MGDFRVVIEALGGHGCQREKGDGDFVVGCEARDCPDCMVRELVRRMKRGGCTIHKAEIVHWPADMEGRSYDKAQEVRDDLLTGLRSNTFPEYERYQRRRS